MALNIGDKAPGFTLVDTERKERSLSEFSGKNVILAFYPGAFTGVCTKEMCNFRDSMASFSGMNAQVVGISVDAPFANKEFATKNNLNFPILCDYNRTAIKAYDIVHNGFAGLAGYEAAYRSVFVLDKNGVIKYKWVSENPGVEPPYDEVNAAVNSLQ